MDFELVAPLWISYEERAKREIYFAVCINNKKYEASLELGKLYRVIPDERQNHMGMYGWSMKLVRTMDMPPIAFIASKCPAA